MHLLGFCLFAFFSQPIDLGLAARYGYPGDKLAGKKEFACQDILIKKLGKKHWNEMLARGVAHRTLPCGTDVVICSRHSYRCTLATIVDRGPFGALDEKGRWHRRRRLGPKEHWRGILDLLPRPAKVLGIMGVQNVVVWASSVKERPNMSSGIETPLYEDGSSMIINSIRPE